MCSVLSDVLNYPRRLRSSVGKPAGSVEISSGVCAVCISPVCIGWSQVPCTWAPQATFDASFEISTYTTRIFSWGPHGLPLSSIGGAIQ